MKTRLFVLSFLISSFALANDLNSLSTTVVTATRYETNSFDLPLSIDVIDTETIHDARVGANLSEVSPRIPGVVINNRNNYAQELAISTRGFGARSGFGVKGVRIYADGIPLSTPDGQGQLGAMNLDNVGQVEFMRGPFSALYGNSSGGVVQSITRKGDKDPTLSLGFSIDRFNTARSSATYEGQLEKLNYIMSASEISSDGWRDHSAYKKENFNGKFIYEQSKDTKITMVLNYFNQPYTLDPQSLSPADFWKDPKKSPVDSTSVRGDLRVYKQQSLAGMILDQNISESQSIRVMGYYGIRENLQYLTTSASGFRRNIGGADLKWMLKETLFDRPYSITAGLSYDKMNDQRQRFDTNSTLSPLFSVGSTTTYTGNKTRYNRDETQNGFSYDQYAQVTFEPTSQWLLIGGIRQSRVKLKSSDKFYDDCAVTPTKSPTGAGTSVDPYVYWPSGCFDTQAWDSGSLTFNNTAPAFGATFKATPNLNIYANYGEGFETPTFSEMTYSNPTTGAGPNLNLKPSESKNYELGFKAFVTNNTKVNMALFKVDSKNEMVVDTYDSTTKQTSYKSIAKTERRGVELSIDSRLPYNFNFYGAYTLMDAEFKEAYTSTGTTTATSGTVYPGKRIPATYKTTAYSELSWKYPAYGFSSAVEMIYFSDSYAFDLNLNTYRALPYTLVNLRSGFKQDVGKWQVSEFLRIDNVTDKTYVSNVKVNSTTPFEPGLPLNATLGVNVSYKF